uniref:dUTPase-like domain-containing protein n=1 Tax=Aquila chrysaetos chrysaetos TaxID=223781 RepID=A0A663F403_AQUCH
MPSFSERIPERRQEGCLAELPARTAGSAGVDVSTIETISLWNSQVHRVPVNAQGPLGNGLSALLLGRSSISLQGIFVLPGVIDADYTGRIYAMIWTPSPPVSIQEGSRIAQLVPFKSNVPCKVNKQRGNAGLGSTGLEFLSFQKNLGNGDCCMI